MVRINTQKTTDQWQANVTETDQGGANQDLLNRINEAASQINDAEERWDEYLTDEQKANMNRLEATLRAQAAAIEGGYYYNPATGSHGEEINYASRDSLAELGSGWVGGLISNYGDDAAKLQPADGEYMGTIEMESSGDPMDPTKLGFSIDDAFEAEMMGEGGSIDKVEVRNAGRDLVVTLIGKNAAGDEIRKSWVIKEGVVRPEPIIFNLTRMSHGITFDASRAYRISDGNYNSYYGTVRGFYIHGTQFDDTIYGSIGHDKIVGWEGDDYIDGIAGDNVIWGDEYYETPGSFGPNGGRDTIRGGAGNNTIYGGGGIDTRFRSDNPSPTNPNAAYEFENVIDDVTGAIPESSNWISGTGWTTYEEGGMVVMEKDGTPGGGEISIGMPDGYNMAFANVGPDGTSLIITFVGHDEHGNPQTFQLKIKDFMRSITGFAPEDIIRLKITGSSGDDIIDFSRIRSTNHVINIEGGAGDDILLGASNSLLSQGIGYDSLVESSVSGSYLRAKEDVLFESEDDPSGYVSTVNPSNPKEILITTDPNFEGTERAAAIRIAAPEGFETGYVAKDPNGTGDLIVILVNPTTKETIVIRVDGATGLDHNDIIVGSRTGSAFDLSGDTEDDYAEGFAAWPGLIPISLDPNDYTIDGGAGADLMFGPKGTNFVKDADDEVIEGNFEDGAGLNNVQASKTGTE